MPNANAGKEMPDTASVMPMRSGHWLRYTAETMPMPMPKITAHTMLVMVSITVGKKRSPISVDTGRRVRIEVPKSPCSMWLKQRLVQPELRAHHGHGLLVGALAGGKARRVAGEHVDEQEHQHGHDEQCRDQAQQAFEKVIQHGVQMSRAGAGTVPPPAGRSIRKQGTGAQFDTAIASMLMFASGMT